MKRLISLFLFIHLLFLSANAQNDKFIFNVYNPNDNVNYSITVNTSDKTLTAKSNGSYVFSFNYYAWKINSSSGRLGFALKSDRVVDLDGISSAFFIITEGGGIVVKLANGNTYPLLAKDNNSHSNTYNQLTRALNSLSQSANNNGPNLFCPDSNHPHAIDLGVAGKWSCCDVGASVPWKFGGYYGWGEIDVKNHYDWNTYRHCNGKIENCRNIGNDIAGTQYDVAYMKWGGKWHMPNREQINNLINNCSKKWTTVNGVQGLVLTAPNGNSIFMPAARYINYDGGYAGDQHDDFSYGTYWLSILSRGYYCAGGAYVIVFKKDGSMKIQAMNRADGHRVRPIYE